MDDLICELLEEPNIRKDNSVCFTDKSLCLIHKIAELCKDIPIVKDTQEQAEQYAENLTAEQIYVDMLHKIVAAPARIYMLAVTRMLIPIIDRKLKERKM